MNALSQRPARGLQRRLMLAFAIFALVLVTLFTLYALAFAYTVEDAYLVEGLTQEESRQREHYLQHADWLVPEDPNTRLVSGPEQFPAELREAWLREPNRREFAGAQGRHYHLQDFQVAGQQAWLVAEVSSRLIFRQMRGEVIAILGWSAGAALMLALLLGWWIARRTTRPLSELVDAVAALQPDQLPEGRWLTSGLTSEADEVGILARALDDLVRRIGAFIEREQEFTRDVSHELRTPLAVIRTLGEQLAHDSALGTDARRKLTAIQQSARQLEQTVTTLLNLARESDPADLSRDRSGNTPLLPLIERAIVEQSSLQPDRQLALVIDVATEAQSDLPESVLQILLANLIGNAFAHGERGNQTDQPDIQIELRHSRLHISNRANAALTGADFEPFRKGSASTGFGLGLAIVRRLCDRHAIDLRLEHSNGVTTASFPVEARVNPASKEPRVVLGQLSE
jgi:signal transduction histidine kinase